MRVRFPRTHSLEYKSSTVGLYLSLKPCPNKRRIMALLPTAAPPRTTNLILSWSAILTIDDGVRGRRRIIFSSFSLFLSLFFFQQLPTCSSIQEGKALPGTRKKDIRFYFSNLQRNPIWLAWKINCFDINPFFLLQHLSTINNVLLLFLFFSSLKTRKIDRYQESSPPDKLNF